MDSLISKPSLSGRLAIILFSSFIIGILTNIAFAHFINLFFYTMFLGTLSAGLFFLVAWFCFGFQKRFDKTHFYLGFFLSICITLLFLSTFPLNIDRSFSVWSLKHLYQAEMLGKPLTPQALALDGQAFFSPKNGEIERRISEQLELKNIILTEKKEIKLTTRGKLVVWFDSTIGKIFNLHPEYSSLNSR
jgi:hypothetical protein